MIRELIVAIALTASMSYGQDWNMLGALWSKPSETAYVPYAFSSMTMWLNFSSGDGSFVPDATTNNSFAWQTNVSVRPVISNEALYVNGATFLQVTNSYVVMAQNGYGVSCWVYVLSRSGQAGIVYDSTFYNRGVLLDAALKPNGIYEKAWGVASSNAISLSNWVFIAYSGQYQSKAVFVMNNTNVTTGPIPNNNRLSGQNIVLGRLGAGNTMVGFIDDVRTYNRYITSNEFLTIMAEGRK